jgi:hypothetical protein
VLFISGGSLKTYLYNLELMSRKSGNFEYIGTRLGAGGEIWNAKSCTAADELGLANARGPLDFLASMYQNIHLFSAIVPYKSKMIIGEIFLSWMLRLRPSKIAKAGNYKLILPK